MKNSSTVLLACSLVICVSAWVLQDIQFYKDQGAELEERLAVAEKALAISEKEKAAYRLAIKDLGENYSCPKTNK